MFTCITGFLPAVAPSAVLWISGKFGKKEARWGGRCGRQTWEAYRCTSARRLDTPPACTRSRAGKCRGTAVEEWGGEWDQNFYVRSDKTTDTCVHTQHTHQKTCKQTQTNMLKTKHNKTLNKYKYNTLHTPPKLHRSCFDTLPRPPVEFNMHT